MFFKKTKVAKRSSAGFLPTFERLEDRLVPHAMVSDMTQVAQMFSRHAGPTTLYLNFDGDTRQSISPYVSFTRSQDIQEALYRTAQVFAPFDVQVRRMEGQGKFSNGNGDTTIFIGDHPNFTVRGANDIGGFTPGNHMDAPVGGREVNHQPNSDPFNIAFVDPITYTNVGINSVRTWFTVQAIAHEAGHTFGLAHIRTSGQDPNPLGSGNPNAPEVMSYDSPNVRFINRAFNITTYNFVAGQGPVMQSGMQPRWNHYDWSWFGLKYTTTTDNIVTQNSYSYLTQVLGARTFGDDWADIADASHVDTSAYVDRTMASIGNGQTLRGKIDRVGEYDVFKTTAAFYARTIQVDVTRDAGSGLTPTLLVFNASGDQIITFNTGTDTSRVAFNVTPGSTYKVVVGGVNGNSTGTYRIQVAQFAATDNRRPKVSTSTASLSAIAALSGTSFSSSSRQTSAYDRVFIQEQPSNGSRQAAPVSSSSKVRESWDSIVPGSQAGAVSTQHLDKVFGELAGRKR